MTPIKRGQFLSHDSTWLFKEWPYSILPLSSAPPNCHTPQHSLKKFFRLNLFSAKNDGLEKKGQTCDKFWSWHPELNVWGLESADSDITPHFGWKTKWTPEFFLFLSFSEAVILPWFSNRIGRTKMLKHLNQLSSGYYLQLNKTKSQKSLRPLKPWSSQFTRAHHTHTGQIIWR